MEPLGQRCVAEFLGTFGLVFVGTGAIVVDAQTGGAVGHVGISLAFGLVVMAMIYAFGAVSGAHLNPAVSVGFAASGRFPWREVAPYGISQVAGALAASVVLRLALPRAGTLGQTGPSAEGGGVLAAVVFEFLLTWILMLVILRVSVGSKETGIMAGAAVGATIAFEALVGGPVSGASMNPARSLAPALVAVDLGHLWIYLTAPLAGALAAVPACRWTQGAGCCDNACDPSPATAED